MNRPARAQSRWVKITAEKSQGRMYGQWMPSPPDMRGLSVLVLLVGTREA
jgi:hypothetical protein